jgi:uncharacterized protein (TIGR03086 family)
VIASPGVLDDLARASDVFAGVIAAVSANQLDAPTPCEGLDVSDLIEHVTDGNDYFTNLLTDGVDKQPVLGEGATLAGRLHGSSVRLLAAFAEGGRVDREYPSPVGVSSGARLAKVRIVEFVVHGWDIAHATGQADSIFPSELCERTLSDAIELYSRRGATFAAPRSIDPLAPAIHRLVAYLGRRPDDQG